MRYLSSRDPARFSLIYFYLPFLRPEQCHLALRVGILVKNFLVLLVATSYLWRPYLQRVQVRLRIDVLALHSTTRSSMLVPAHLNFAVGISTHVSKEIGTAGRVPVTRPFAEVYTHLCLAHRLTPVYWPLLVLNSQSSILAQYILLLLTDYCTKGVCNPSDQRFAIEMGRQGLDEGRNISLYAVSKAMGFIPRNKLGHAFFRSVCTTTIVTM